MVCSRALFIILRDGESSCFMSRRVLAMGKEKTFNINKYYIYNFFASKIQNTKSCNFPSAYCVSCNMSCSWTVKKGTLLWQQLTRVSPFLKTQVETENNLAPVGSWQRAHSTSTIFHCQKAKQPYHHHYQLLSRRWRSPFSFSPYCLCSALFQALFL